MRDGFTRREMCTTGIAMVLAAQTGRAFGQVSGLRSPPRLKVPGDVTLSAGTDKGEWRTYGGTLSSTRYSPLDQITADNFSTLEVAWRFRPDNLGPVPDPNLQATPLMIDGILYLTAGSRRAAVALDSRTGEMLWKYNIDEGIRGQKAARPGSGRGLSYWSDGTEKRIIYVTPGYRMIALDAKTGRPVPGFGDNGVVDLKTQLGQDADIDLDTADIGLHATPLVVGDVIVVGAAHLPSSTPMKKHIKGAIRGYDARSGKRLWIFNTIPQKGEFGHETWLNGSEVYTGNAGSWAQMSADPELGLVYVGIELPTGDWYGGSRPGAGLFGESLVALDANTGERRWHFQLVHHGIWDFDIPCASILADITVNGRKIKAVAQPSKQAWVYVFDRETGKPVWPIPERKVPIGDVPTEWYSPTQPHVTKPPAFDRQGVTVDDLIDFTPELRAEAEKLIQDYRIGPLFTPATFSRYPRPRASIVAPYGDGAGQWPGGALDPESNILYIFSNSAFGAFANRPADPKVTDQAMVPGLIPPPGETARRPNRLTVQGLPLLKPPYGRITALDLNKGSMLWQVPHGETPDDVRNNPALKGLTIPTTGSFGKVGTLVTRTLIIAGEGTVTTAEDGSKGAWLKAYDKRTGAQVGRVRMAKRATGSPMTYSVDGQQYVVIAMTSPGEPGELVAYRLPR
ncbi:PQQ-binding-like beta-propeller repeat protein [Sphingobium algorifonticola]|uniref:Pyrroloquinoline quinone-dependent dehydrogenase n=1 Tax=Sphingobium algorifonticola TaxID=2008318 RepID=A0A437JBE3_9SPHN|nr:PQQ-binding-like beta-propeller repeat protein [Sphingobium algorifonticola]RVT43191.1 pyrroloquinoline quinone-dependent dehydrogenase [Sphingobium algorifonticola]